MSRIDYSAAQADSPFLHRLQLIGKQSELLLNHGRIHAALWGLEWQVEKQRLAQIVICAAVAIMAGIVFLFFVSMGLLVISWGTAYCMWVFMGICLLYILVAVVAWQKLSKAIARGSESFAATRQQIAEDLRLFKEYFS